MSNYLFIDTSTQEEIRVAVFDNNGLVAKKELKVGFKYSEKMLTGVDSLLKKTKISLKNTKAILVIEGPGRFSALRTGVSVANTLAWSLGVPVIGIKGQAGQGVGKDYWPALENTIVNKIKKLKAKKFKQAVVPQYGQEPNITIKK